MALADIPGYGAYIERRRQNQQQPLAELQQVGAVQGLLAKMQAQKQDEQTRAALAESGGDVNKAIEALIKGGNVEGAQKLATVADVQRKSKEVKAPPFRTITRGTDQVNQDLTPEGWRDVGTGPRFAPDKPPTPPEILRLQDAASKLPPGSPIRAQIEARVKMLGERPQGVQVNMPPTSGTFQGPDGKFYIFRVGKDGKTEAVPIQTPTGEALRPPETAAERKDRLSGAEVTADISEIERLGTQLDGLVQQNQGLFKGVVGPQGYIGRIMDLAGGMAGAGTPALDFANKSKLFLASVRKMVEKDPNLSNQERQNLFEAIGVGFWQTGNSSIRARQDVMQYVRSKRLAGLKDGGGRQQASQEDLEFTAKKHGITVDEVKRRLGIK